LLAPYLRQAGITACYLLSGRPREDLFDVGEFGHFEHRDGLTFCFENGRLKYWRTLIHNQKKRFIRDLNAMDLSEFDLVISDYEPITAWAAKLQSKPSIGLGHQYAFEYNIPRVKTRLPTELFLRHLAPTDHSLALHWRRYTCHMLPPMVDVISQIKVTESNKILVYLPFEDLTSVRRLLAQFDGYRFYLYHPDIKSSSVEQVVLRAPSRTTFAQDLKSCTGVICNAGFELPSEALHFGKKLWVKPLSGQPEQMSNALALRQLGLAESADHLSYKALCHWLENGNRVQAHFPNVPEAIAQWLKRGGWESDNTQWLDKLWQNVSYAPVASLSANAISRQSVIHRPIERSAVPGA